MGYVERCLYEYKANMALVEEIKEEIKHLMSLSSQGYEVVSRQINNPVAEVTMKVISKEDKIKRTEKKIRPVRKLYEDLKGTALYISQLREILELKYFEQESTEDIKRKLSISGATLYRRKKKLLRLARKYFGEED